MKMQAQDSRFSASDGASVLPESVNLKNIDSVVDFKWKP
jgi:hypothetical protein